MLKVLKLGLQKYMVEIRPKQYTKKMIDRKRILNMQEEKKVYFRKDGKLVEKMPYHGQQSNGLGCRECCHYKMYWLAL